MPNFGNSTKYWNISLFTRLWLLLSEEVTHLVMPHCWFRILPPAICVGFGMCRATQHTTINKMHCSPDGHHTCTAGSNNKALPRTPPFSSGHSQWNKTCWGLEAHLHHNYCLANRELPQFPGEHNEATSKSQEQVPKEIWKENITVPCGLVWFVLVLEHLYNKFIWKKLEYAQIPRKT